MNICFSIIYIFLSYDHHFYKYNCKRYITIYFIYISKNVIISNKLKQNSEFIFNIYDLNFNNLY